MDDKFLGFAREAYIALSRKSAPALLASFQTRREQFATAYNGIALV
jgi:hypothetical protein